MNEHTPAKEITHVIFDFDGVLIDSERQYSIANARCLERYGKEFTLEMKAAMMGRTKESAIRTLLEMNGLETHERAMQKYIDHYDLLLEELIPNSAELPGANALIEHFHAHGIPMAICTGSGEIEFEQKTRNYAKWLERIPRQHITLSASDPEVQFGKPHPQPYEVTQRRFTSLKPERPDQVLVFEDSINGVLSALAAGMTVVMVPQVEFLPLNWEDEWKPKLEPQLAEILPTLEHFNPAKYGLPAFNP